MWLAETSIRVHLVFRRTFTLPYLLLVATFFNLRVSSSFYRFMDRAQARYWCYTCLNYRAVKVVRRLPAKVSSCARRASLSPPPPPPAPSSRYFQISSGEKDAEYRSRKESWREQKREERRREGEEKRNRVSSFPYSYPATRISPLNSWWKTREAKKQPYYAYFPFDRRQSRLMQTYKNYGRKKTDLWPHVAPRCTSDSLHPPFHYLFLRYPYNGVASIIRPRLNYWLSDLWPVDRVLALQDYFAYVEGIHRVTKRKLS